MTFLLKTNKLKQIIKNLKISKIELRSEDSIDIQKYTHSRKIVKIVVKLTGQILNIKHKYLEVTNMFFNVRLLCYI